jgi:predicted Zn-dependent protease
MWNRFIKPGKSIASLLLLTLILLHSGISVAQSIELDKKLGAENAKLVEVQIGLVNDKELTGYVQSVGNRLIAALEENPFEFHFKEMDIRSIVYKPIQFRLE